jgi:hypothetical protein
MTLPDIVVTPSFDGYFALSVSGLLIHGQQDLFD